MITSAAVTAVVDKFKNDLLLYTQKNPMHNRYILERLYQINASLEERSYCFERDCFLSQQGITEAQLLMSARWVQHYAVGPYYLAKNKEKLARRVFTCRDSDYPAVGIHSVMSRLRLEGRCLDIFGGPCGHVAVWCRGPGRRTVSDLVSSKNSVQLELVMPRARASAHGRSCVVS